MNQLTNSSVLLLNLANRLAKQTKGGRGVKRMTPYSLHLRRYKVGYLSRPRDDSSSGVLNALRSKCAPVCAIAPCCSLAQPGSSPDNNIHNYINNNNNKFH